jgi:hypothetical protein
MKVRNISEFLPKYTVLQPGRSCSSSPAVCAVSLGLCQDSAVLTAACVWMSSVSPLDDSFETTLPLPDKLFSFHFA